MMLVALYLGADRHVVQARGLIVVYLTAGAIAAGWWVAGAMVSGPARYAGWVVAVAVELTAPVVATRRSAGLPLQLGHLPERLGCWSSWCSANRSLRSPSPSASGGGLSPAAVLAAVMVVLVGEAVAGLAKQHRGTLTTRAPQERP
jgi:hypothetical protein